MFFKEITYTDFDGVSLTEKFYFHLSKIESAKVMTQLTEQKTDEDAVRKLMNAKRKNISYIIDMIETVVKASYGVKSDDGKRFIKSQEITDEFMQSNAYEEFVMWLVNDENAMFIFLTELFGIDMPTFKAAVEKEMGAQKLAIAE